MSEYLTTRQLRGLERIGDLMHPGGDGMPSFSASGCIRRADDVVGYLPEGDRGDLAILLGVLALLPGILLRVALRLFNPECRLPGGLGGILRLAGLGLKGVVMSLYYADPDVLARLEYELHVVTDDMVDEPART